MKMWGILRTLTLSYSTKLGNLSLSFSNHLLNSGVVCNFPCIWNTVYIMFWLWVLLLYMIFGYRKLWRVSIHHLQTPWKKLSLAQMTNQSNPQAHNGPEMDPQGGLTAEPGTVGNSMAHPTIRTTWMEWSWTVSARTTSRQMERQ